MLSVDTIPGSCYSVASSVGCTVSTPLGKVLCRVLAGVTGSFHAESYVTLVDDDEAVVKPVPVGSHPSGGGGSSSGGSSGGAGLSASGEPVVALSGGSFTVKHATWFDNAGQAAVSVLPAAWKNEVMTCYLKSAVPVSLAGVTWLYGQPAMAAGYTFVIALQQVDAATVLANLAYTLPQ